MSSAIAHSRPVIGTLLLAVGLVATAAAVTVPLPDLTGGYEYATGVEPDFGYPEIRTTSFTIPPEVVAIDQLVLVLSGAWTEGEVTCYDGPEPVTDPFISPLGLSLTSDAFPGEFFFAVVEISDGPFVDLMGEFQACCGPDAPELGDLLGQEIQAELFHDAAIVGLCAVTLDPYGELTDVHLEITGTVPVEVSTWSRVKGLYR